MARTGLVDRKDRRDPISQLDYELILEYALSSGRARAEQLLQRAKDKGMREYGNCRGPEFCNLIEAMWWKITSDAEERHG